MKLNEMSIALGYHDAMNGNQRDLSKHTESFQIGYGAGLIDYNNPEHKDGFELLKKRLGVPLEIILDYMARQELL